jgi:hypothetical protein
VVEPSSHLKSTPEYTDEKDEMNLSRDALIDWLESLRDYNEETLRHPQKPARERVLLEENAELGRAIRALVDGERIEVRG